MSFGVGIGDIWMIFDGVVTICKGIHDAPEEIKAATRDMELMGVTLKAVKVKIGDEKQFVSKQPEISPVIKKTLKPLKKDLKDMKEILEGYTQSQSFNIVGRIGYMIKDKAKLKDLRDQFVIHRGSNLPMVLQLIQNASQKEQTAKLNKLVIGQGKLLKGQEKLLKDQAKAMQDKDQKEYSKKLEQLLQAQEAERKKREEHDKQQKQILKMFEERLPSKKDNAVSSTSDILAQLEQDLVAKGLSPEKAREHLFPITKALLKEPISTKPEPKKKVPAIKVDDVDSASNVAATGNLHGSKSDSGSKGKPKGSGSKVPQNLTANNLKAISAKDLASAKRRGSAGAQEAAAAKKSLVVEPTKKPNSNSGPKRPLSAPPTTKLSSPDSDNENLKILCVDGSNGIRSVLAQTYLEVMRAWTVHQTGRWIFSRVESAGSNVETDFTKAYTTWKAHLPADAPIPTVYTSGLTLTNLKWVPEDRPEIDGILERMKHQFISGLAEEDFRTYDYILCFDKHIKLLLLKLQLHALQNSPSGNAKSAIVMLPGCESYSANECLARPDKMESLVKTLKEVIEAFLAEKISGWSFHVMGEAKGGRLLQFPLPRQKIEQAEIADLERASGCWIRIAEISGKASSFEEQCLVSVIGPKGSNRRWNQPTSLMEMVEGVIRGKSKWKG